jgi:SMODS and SLOG-associating 2TM effector domain family 5
VAEPMDHLLKSMKQTAGSRFIAAKRLERHDKGLTRLIAFSSVYVVMLTALPYFLKVRPHVTDLFNLVTITLSLVVLVSSLMQYSSAEIVNAEQQHRSGLEINEIRRELLLKETNATTEELLDFTRRYNAVLQKYSVNHERLDFDTFQLERPDEFPWLRGLARARIIAKVVAVRYTPTLCLVLVTIFFVAIVIYGSAPFVFTHQQ